MIDFQFQGHTTRICKVQKEPSVQRFTGILIPIASIIQIVTRMGQKKTAFLAHFLKNQRTLLVQKVHGIVRGVDTDAIESVLVLR